MIEEHYSTLNREDKEYNLDFNGLVDYLFYRGRPNLETTKGNLTRRIFDYNSSTIILDYEKKGDYDNIILKIKADTNSQEKEVFDKLDDILLVPKKGILNK